MRKRKAKTKPVRGIARGPLPLKPSRFHKSRKTYDRQKEKVNIKSLIKTLR